MNDSMRFRKRLAVIFATFAVFVSGFAFLTIVPDSVSYPKWLPIGPEGGDIRGLAVNPSNPIEMFAASHSYGGTGRIYKSVDHGLSWQKLAVLDDSLYDLAIPRGDSNTLYVLASGSLFRSTDKGSSWISMPYSAGLPRGSYFYPSNYRAEIAVPARARKTIFVSGSVYRSGKSCMAVLKSTDGGAHWVAKKIFPSSREGAVYCVEVDPLSPNIVYVGGYTYDGSASYFKLMKSQDGGDSWIDKTGAINAAPMSIAIDPANCARLYVGTQWAIFRSEDAAESWTKNNGYAYATDLIIDPANTNVLYAGYDRAFYKSSDGGQNWQKYANGLYGYCTRLAKTSSRILYGSYAGVFSSDDEGVNWSPSQAGMKATTINGIAVFPASPNVQYCSAYLYGILKTSDFGNTWQTLPRFGRCGSISSVAVHPGDPNDLLIMASG